MLSIQIETASSTTWNWPSSHSFSQWEVMFDRQSCEVANRKRDVNERWVWAGVSCTVCRRGRGGETGRKRSITLLVGHLFEVLIGGVFIAVLLHLRQVTFIRGHGSIHLRHKWFGFQTNHYFDSFDSYSSCVHRLTSMIPWWMDVYCFFLSITRVMTMMVAMTTPPTIRPIIAPLLELTSSAKKTWTNMRLQSHGLNSHQSRRLHHNILKMHLLMNMMQDDWLRNEAKFEIRGKNVYI